MRAETCRHALAVMTTAGLYETSGDWLYEVGLPGKSGIGGGIVTVSPGKGGLGTFAPPLDEAGNSVRGQLVARFLAQRLGLDLFTSRPGGAREHLSSGHRGGGRAGPGALRRATSQMESAMSDHKHTADPRTGSLVPIVHADMPRLRSELAQLVAIPSISALGLSGGDARRRCSRPTRASSRLLRGRRRPDRRAARAARHRAGRASARSRRPPGAPTVLLYSHYDVVPVGDEAKWHSPPFEATERDGAIYGRGAADTKSNILMHVGALRAWGGRPPVGIKIVIEGQEEVGSAFTTYPPTRPRAVRRRRDGDRRHGQRPPGVPTLTIALRGMAMVTVEVRTLAGPKHSGQFGGAAPDALITLLHALASLHDEHGDVDRRRGCGARSGRAPPTARRSSASSAEVEPGVPFFGTGGLGERVWSGPAHHGHGIDVLPVDGAVNAVVPYARAKLSLRVHPEQDAVEAQAALVRHLEGLQPVRHRR